MKSISQLDRKPRPHCYTCGGEGWVCENHPGQAWKGGLQPCCGGAGRPCACHPLASLTARDPDPTASSPPGPTGGSDLTS